MRSPSKPRVDIIILNWNGWKDTVDCLARLRALEYPNYRVLVLDNGSTDGSLERIASWAAEKAFSTKTMAGTVGDGESVERNGLRIPCVDVDDPRTFRRCEAAVEDNRAGRMILLRAEENLGFAEGNNRVLRLALASKFPADVFFLLNNDTQADPGCLDRAVEVMTDRAAAAVGFLIKDLTSGRVLFNGDCRRPELFYFYNYCRKRNSVHDIREPYPTRMIWGTAMLVSRTAVLDHEKEFGFTFNPELFLYIEDNQFCLELAEMGEALWMSPLAVVFHKHWESQVNQEYDRSLLLYYVTRNTLLVAGRHLKKGWRWFFHAYYPAARLKDLVVQVLSGRTGDASAIWQGLRDGYLKRAGQWAGQSADRPESRT